MKEKVIYICEMCGREFESKEAAEKCEKSHETKANLDLEPHYAPADKDLTGLPDYFTCKYKGSEYRYERKMVKAKGKNNDKPKDKDKDKDKDKGKDKN